MTAFDREIHAIEAPAAAAARRVRRHFFRKYRHAQAETKQSDAPLRQITASTAEVPKLIKPAKPKAVGRAIIQSAHEIIARLEAGETAAEIARSLKVHRKSVYNHLYRAGLAVPERKCPKCGISCGQASHCPPHYHEHHLALMRANYRAKVEAGKKGETE